MSRSDQRTDEITETQLAVLNRDGWRCTVKQDGTRCTARATQCAHVLPQDVVHIRRYGEAIIHHPANLRSVCGLAHNAAVQINYRARPLEADRFAEHVRALMEGPCNK